MVHRQALVAESPVWDGRSGMLLWVDVLRGEVHRTDVGHGSDEVTAVGTAVGAVALRQGDGLVAAAGDGFCLLPGDDGAPIDWLWRIGYGPAPPAPPVTAPNALVLRMNDAKCDPAGRLWGGSMTVDRRPGACGLYRLEAGGVVTTALDGVTVSNGLGFSPDGRTMYYIDTPRRTIDAFDFDVASGAIHGRRSFVVLEDGVGNPDGMTVDSSGALWVALAHGSAIRRYTPAGRLDTVVPMPVAKVTSCTFGGGDLRTLFVTSACVGLSERELVDQPLAGAVLAVETGIAGLPADRFAG